MPAFKDLTGLRYGRLTVVSRIANNRHNQPQWLCKCDCGADWMGRAGNLTTGTTQSCGCFNRDDKRRVCIERNTTHGLSRSHEHTVWGNMKSRCYDPNNRKFKNYGGRGIQVHPDWRDSFERFLADMGKCPPGLSLDRIDTDGHYEPGNCRWADQKTQQNNRRNNRMITFRGETLTLAQWSERLGKPKTTLWRYANAGKPLE